MQKLFVIIAGISGALAVIIGAFGAHGLKKVFEKTGAAEHFETGSRYHFYHTFAILAVALLIPKTDIKLLNYAGYLFTAGIVIFSGSLYGIGVTGYSKLGMITPIGGLCFIVGWVLLVVSAVKGM